LAEADCEFDLTMPDTSIDFGFVAPPPPDPIGELQTLWQRARTVAENTLACPCHGVVAGVVDPDVMEHNVLDLLRARYRNSDHQELVALIEQRLRKSPFAGMRRPFPHWLNGLRDNSIDAIGRQTFYDDLAAALRSYADAGPTFACV